MAIFNGSKKLGSVYFGNSKIGKIYNGTKLVYQSSEIEPLCFTALEDGAVLSYSIVGTLTVEMQYSLDGKTWNDWDGSVITVNNGESIYVRNNYSTLSKSQSSYLKFVTTSAFACSGNIMSLLNGKSKITQSYSFFRLFYQCAGITTPPELPATTLASWCYKNLFEYCTGLLTPPALPATKLEFHCYDNIFLRCHSLQYAPELPATELAEYCYSGMFHTCKALTTPPLLPATELKPYCYYWMFYECSSLVVAPNLPATELANNCYQKMFYGCSKLLINENGTKGTAIFICPETIPTDAVTDMFTSTGGSFTGTPTANNTYNYYEEETPWYLDDSYIASLTESDIGTEKTIEVNGQEHTVRLIGIDHDVDENGNKLHTTWEFANIISDTSGNSLGIAWNDTNTTSTANYDYINSSIRKALCGSGNFSGDLLWCQKGATSWSDTYKNKTILSMLPSDLQAVLKTVKKSVGTTSSYTETSYTDKLFMLSSIEMGYTSSFDKGFGTTYSYYSGHTGRTDAIRIKKQVNNSEVYTSWSDIPSGSGQAYQGTVYNYAGYNYKTDNTGGGNYWYRSPNSGNAYYAWRCNYDGSCDDRIADGSADGVAPAFCLGETTTKKVNIKRPFRFKKL